MAERGAKWPWAVLALAVLGIWAYERGGDQAAPPAAAPAASASAAATASASAPPSSGAPAAASRPPGDYAPRYFAAEVKQYAAEAGVNPQLVMAVLFNEAYKPHGPDVERAWQKMKPDASFGIANMHRAAYDETRQGRPFADRPWEDLPDDPALAVRAAAWYLHDLGAQLPAHPAASLSRDELMALGYNTGAGNMLLFARGTKPGPEARSYLDKLHDNWSKSADALAAR
ncbi:lytic transglycosylase domain-containing protein [Kitasatospora sp. NA04385]|uniref:transglycosylase SLT domain-containing protein n=1 Tax=Kitasatospora sp. NA04385 TaxID=2742135 RepID=UPI0015906F32|nr:transglycosylase SLT domain-containing protein [Kitasatospora sp. NA04385]QKW23852.1 lytic transglycosylase domain-containing protein [Kitasatospora sp. NA04385]